MGKNKKSEELCKTCAVLGTVTIIGVVGIICGRDLVFIVGIITTIGGLVSLGTHRARRH